LSFFSVALFRFSSFCFFFLFLNVNMKQKKELYNDFFFLIYLFFFRLICLFVCF
jgi:hypothetical protein